MVNKTILQGRLTADPEVKQSQSGVSVVNFRVAWSNKYKDKESKLFLPCVAFRGAADMVGKFFHKGKEIIVEGSLYTDEYTDKEGNNRSVIKMTVDKVHFVGSKSDGDGGGNTEYSAPAPAEPAPEFTDLTNNDGELPF